MSQNTSSLHDKVIPYSRLKQSLPDRIKFLNPQERNEIDQTIEKNEQLLFLPTYLMETSLQDKKYDKAMYKIILMGIFKDGRKVNIVIDGIEPYFEIKIPNGTKEQQIESISYIINLLEGSDLTAPTRKTKISAKQFKYYQTSKTTFLRVYYNKTKNRAEAIRHIRRNGFETTADDLASYYRVVCRDHLTTFSAWATLDNYKIAQIDTLKGETYRVNIKNYRPYLKELTGNLLRDKTMSCCWDIETWSKGGELPVPENPDDNVFCLSMTFQWIHENDSFLRICLCDLPANAKPGYLTIVCGSEKNIIQAFSDVFAFMRPEFIFGFNDSDYDWNWIVKRSAQYKGLLSYIAKNFDSTIPYISYTDANVLQFNFKKEQVKVEATTYIDGFALMMPGYIPIDVRTIFRRIYPTAEFSSLKWYLSENKLGGKEDMPYMKMFEIYGRYLKFLESHSNEIKNLKSGSIADLKTDNWEPEEIKTYNLLKEQLDEINYYCVIDAQRCHDLVKVRSVIMDHREVSNLAYTSVYDAFFRANGMKVRNLTIAIGQTDIFGIRFSNITNNVVEDGKYPGAFVFPPKKGLKISKLSIEERIKKAKLTKGNLNVCQEWNDTTPEEIKLYYSLIDRYGAVVTEDELSSIEQTLINEKTITQRLPSKFTKFWTESIGRPIAGLDFASLYPSLIRTYNFSPEYCILDKKQAMDISKTGQKLTKVDFVFNGQRRLAYFVWHNNKYDPKEQGFQFGVYPYILNDLFNKRAILKKKAAVYAEKLEEFKLMHTDFKSDPKLLEEYTDAVFNFNYLTSKQSALKVFMNTFYGEAGNKVSPFFVLEVAGGITSYGQKNIKFAYAYTREQGCEVYYGDSVAEYTPIRCRVDGVECYCEIKDLASDEDYTQYNNDKQIAVLENHEIWSDLGWTPIKHVIRHKTDKKMYRVLTHNSVVDVTADHSLLDENGKNVKPEDSLGVNMLTKPHPITHSDEQLVSKELAWVLGLFVAEGSCGTYNCKSGVKSSWGIVNQDQKLLNTSKKYLENEYPEYGWKILDCMKSSSVYKLVPVERKDKTKNKIRGQIRKLVTIWRDMCYYGQSKVVPECILSSNEEIQLEFFKGYYWDDGDKSSNNNTYTTDFDKISKRFDIKSQMSAFSFYTLCKMLGYNVSVNCRSDKLDIYRLTITKKNQRKEPTKVKTLFELPTTTAYVYDIETDNHHFAAGVGELVVHNTDSLYISMPERVFKDVDRAFYTNKMEKLKYWCELVRLSFAEIASIKDGVNAKFFEDNLTKFLAMAFEEFLYPVAFTAKKKYFGVKHLKGANFHEIDMFIKGLEVKKRGVSDVLRKTFMEIIDACCNPDNIYDLMELVCTKIDDIYHRQWSNEDFIQTGVYKTSKKNVKIHTFVNRMKEQKVEIKPNERFNYVLVKKYPYVYDLRGRKKELSIGDKMELSEIAERNKMEIDLDYYMKGSINGQLARLITYHDMFTVEPLDTSDDEIKIAEEKSYKNACKFIESYCEKYYASYNTFGKTHQKIFKTANKAVSNVIKEYDELASDLLGANVNYDDFEGWFVEYTEKQADKYVKSYGQIFITEKLDELAKQVTAEMENADDKDVDDNVENAVENNVENAVDEDDADENDDVDKDDVDDDIPTVRQKPKPVEKSDQKEVIRKEIKRRKDEKLKDLQKVFYGNGNNSLIAIRELAYNNTMAILRKRLRENIDVIMRIYRSYNSSLDDIMNLIKCKIGFNDDLFKPTKEATDYKLEDFNQNVIDDLDSEIKNNAVNASTKILNNDRTIQSLAELKALYNNMLAAHITIKRTRDIISYLKLKRDQANKVIVRPKDEVINELNKRSMEEDRAELMKLNI